MKKIFIIILLVCIILILSSCVSSKQIAVGMSYEEFLSTKKDMNFLEYRNYVFYVGSYEKNIVVEFGRESNLVEKIEAFPKVRATEEDFYSIKAGMTVFDVVEKVGIPSNSVSFGLSTLDFECIDGLKFRVLWDQNMKVIEVIKVN